MKQKLLSLTAFLLLTANPLILHSLANDPTRAIAIGSYLALCAALLTMMRYGDARSIVSTALIFAIAMIADARLLYVLLALVPFLVFLGPPDMLRKSPHSFYLLMLFPAAALLGGYFYLHLFVQSLDFGFVQYMGWEKQPPYTSLGHFGGDYDYTAPLHRTGLDLITVSFAVVPLAVFTPVFMHKERLIAMPLLIATLAPVIAALTASRLPFPDDPASLLPLLAAPAYLSARILIRRDRGWLAILLLIAGWAARRSPAILIS